MGWLRLTMECPASEVDALSKLFGQFDAIAVTSEAVTDEALFAGVDEDPVYWHRTAVSALLDESIDLDILIACVRNRIGSDNLYTSRVEVLAEQNWVEAHKTGHGNMVFADRLCISPSWTEPDRDYPAVLVLDPGLAFGTGRHATTALCLDWLARQELEGLTLIDYGCGSGILGLAAAKLGAEAVYAVDIDKQALMATASNAANNYLEDRLIAATADDAAVPTADILIANILLNPLVALAPRLAELVRDDGRLVLSGILSTQAEECLAAFTPWFNMLAPVFEDEWALLEGSRITHRV